MQSEPIIVRENVVQSILSAFRKGSNLILIDGDPGIGVSTVLDQLALAYERTVFVRLTTASEMGYDPARVIQQLAEGLSNALNDGRECPSVDHAPAMYRTLLNRLGKMAARDYRVAFVVDGLHQIPSNDRATREQLVDLLPIGQPGCLLVLTGKVDDYAPKRFRSVRPQYMTIQGFTLDETKTFMSDCLLADDLLVSIWKSAGCNPSVLSSARRQLACGVKPDVLLSALCDDPPAVFKTEWECAEMDKVTRLAVAIVAHDRQTRTVEQLGSMIGEDTQLLKERLAALRFLTIDLEQQEIDFVSPLFKAFAQQQTQRERSHAHDLVIKAYFKDPEDVKARIELPHFLAQEGRHDELLRYLSPGQVSSSVKLLGSAQIAHKQATLATSSAKTLERYDEFVRFAIHGATFANIYGTQPSDAEVRALLALKKVDEALLLAESATEAEVRLQLVARVGRAAVELGKPVDDRIVSLIRGLCSTVEVALLPEGGLGLVEDLLLIKPELGFEILDKATKNNRQKERTWAFVELAVEAAKQSDGDLFPIDRVKELQDRITDPQARLVAVCRATSYAEYTGSGILSEAKALDKTSDKIAFLASWLASNPVHPDALLVANAALETMLHATDNYMPEAGALRCIARPLEHSTDPHVLDLVAKIETLKGVVERTGPTVEVTRLELSLAHAQWNHNRISAAQRLNTILFDTVEHPDPSIRAACLAQILVKLTDIDANRSLDVQEGLHRIAEAELRASIVKTLASTADHHLVLEETIGALASRSSCLDLALDTTDKYNSRASREAGLFGALSSILSEPTVSFGSAAKVLERLKHRRTREPGTILTLAGAAELEKRTPEDEEAIQSLVRDVIQNGEASCELICTALRAVARYPSPDETATYRLLKQLEDAWIRIEGSGRSVEAGFEIATALAEPCPAIAEEYAAKARGLRQEVAFDTPSRIETYYLILRLAVRALGGLLGTSRDNHQDILDVAEAIKALPSRIQQLALWVELALRFHAAGRIEDCQKIRQEHVERLIADATCVGLRQRTTALVEAAAVLIACNVDTGLALLASLPQPDRDRALYCSARYLLTQVPTHEPFEGAFEDTRDIPVDNLLGLLRIAEVAEQDSLAYLVIQAVCKSAAANAKLSREMKNTIARKVKEMAESKFPAPGYIEHDGYVIVAEAHVLKLRGAGMAEWRELAERGRAIPNESDRVYVILVIAEALPEGFSLLQQELLVECEKSADALSSMEDRLQRTLDIADRTRSNHGLLSRRMLGSAERMFGPSTTSARIRRAADIAYRLDSQFAQKFAAATDDDPARAKARTVMQQELSAIADSQKIGNEGWLSDDDAKSANASWSALARRNAKGVSHLGKQDIWALIERAAGVPLRLSFPMLNLAFATAEQFYSGSNDSARYLRAMFAGAIEATRVARNLATGSRRSVSVRPLGASSTSRLVGAGQRAAALEWLEEWCAAEAKESLVMCDPYFGLEDLEAIKLVQSVAGNIRIQVITSKKALRNVASPHDETFRRYWRQNISTVDPPRTEIMSIGVGELGISPIHDRWWIAAKSVLHFGTSFSGLGKRDSEILLEGEASDVRSLVTSYLSRERIRHDEHRIEYTMFSI